MQIILVSDKLATAKSFSLSGRNLTFFLLAQGLFIISLAALLTFGALRLAPHIGLESTSAAVETPGEAVGSLALRLGQMQAELLRLDALATRLTALAGIKSATDNGVAPNAVTNQNAPEGRGGPLIPLSAMDKAGLLGVMDNLSQQLNAHADTLSAMENLIMEARISKLLLPTSLPVATPWLTSSYGLRSDPITGQTAMHTGVDFPAPTGTAIKAAAAGIVLEADRESGYGNTVDVDHGNGLVTRYAHASRILVHPGQVIRRGEIIALVGNTGRSTGPHLHFEVRLDGVPQNPNRFLEIARGNDRKQGSLAAAH